MWTWIQRLAPTDLDSSDPEASPPSHVGDGAPDPGQVQVSESGAAVCGNASSSDDERTSEEWIDALRCRNQRAMETLQSRLSQGLLAALKRAALRRRVPRRTEALVRESAREALEEILDKLDTFRAESCTDGRELSERRFTTWAQKIAVHIAFSKLRGND